VERWGGDNRPPTKKRSTTLVFISRGSIELSVYLENGSVVMSSAVQTSSPRPASQSRMTSVAVDVATIDTLRAIAPEIDTLAECWMKGTQSTIPVQASRQFMDVQLASAKARQALEQKFPEFKNARGQEPSEGTTSVHSLLREWARGLHGRLRALEERIRDGYKTQEDPVTLRNAVLSKDSRSAIAVLSTIAESSTFSNFNVIDHPSARALGIRSNLATLPLVKTVR
jgi:hypothetical protein